MGNNTHKEVNRRMAQRMMFWFYLVAAKSTPPEREAIKICLALLCGVHQNEPNVSGPQGGAGKFCLFIA
jgi:hypothetical protein